MKVLINATMLGNRSGTGRYCQGIMEGFAELIKENPAIRQQIDFLIPNEFHHNVLNCISVRSSNNPIKRIIWEQTRLPRLWQEGILLHGLAFSLPLIKHGTSIVTVHDMAYKRYPQTIERGKRLYYGKIFDHAIKSADAIVAISQFTKEEIINFFPNAAPKTSVIYPGGANLPLIVDKEANLIRKKYDLDFPFFLTVGTLEPRKNLGFLLKGFQKYLNDRGQLKLVIVGRKGWLNSTLFKPYNELMEKGNIHVLRYLSDRDLSALYISARALVFPSLYEGFGLPLLEAWSMGTATLVPDAHVFKEIAKGASLFFEPNNLDSFVHSLHVLSNKNNIKSFVELGKKRVKNFSYKRCAKLLWDLYIDL